MNQIFLFLINFSATEIFFYLKTIFIIISILISLAIIILLFKNGWIKDLFLIDFTEFLTNEPFGTKESFKEWTKIVNRLKSNKEPEYKLAIIEADALLDEVLKNMGYKGETMKERLKQLKSSDFLYADEIIDVHKIRNDVVYNPDYQLTLDEAERIINIYEKTFRKLELF